MKNEIIHKNIRSYIEDFAADDFPEMYWYAEKRDVPSVEKSVGSYLSMLTSITKPKNILEIGCGIGIAAKYMLRGHTAKYTGIDANLDRVSKAKEYLTTYNNVKIIHSRGEEFLKNNKEKFDFVFIDSIKKHYDIIWNLLITNLNNKAVVVFDDVLLYGYVCQEESEVAKKYIDGRESLKSFINNIMSQYKGKSSLLPIGNGVLTVSYES